MYFYSLFNLCFRYLYKSGLIYEVKSESSLNLFLFYNLYRILSLSLKSELESSILMNKVNKKRTINYVFSEEDTVVKLESSLRNK
jgi:hypothetical protein